MMSLLEMQRAILTVLRTPLTAEERMHDLALDGKPMESHARTWLSANSRLSAFECLEIYNRQYWFRLLSALSEDFPTLARYLGDDYIQALSIDYLGTHPSQSFTLRNLGSRLVTWMVAHPQWGSVEYSLARDIARVEWASIEAFDNTACEPLTQIEASQVYAETRLQLQPHLRLIEMEWPADALVLQQQVTQRRAVSETGTRHQRKGNQADLRIPRKRRTRLAVHRVEDTVYFRRLRREEFLILTALEAGLPLARAIAIALADSRLDPEVQAQHVRQWFARWTQLGWLAKTESMEVDELALIGEVEQ